MTQNSLDWLMKRNTAFCNLYNKRLESLKKDNPDLITKKLGPHHTYPFISHFRDAEPAVMDAITRDDDPNQSSGWLSTGMKGYLEDLKGRYRDGNDEIYYLWKENQDLKQDNKALKQQLNWALLKLKGVK